MEQVGGVFEKITKLESTDINNRELLLWVEFENIYLETNVKIIIIYHESIQTTSNRKTEVKLPKIDVPVFIRNLKAWPNFYDVIESFLIQKCKYL